MLLCSKCDKGFHTKCLSMRRAPARKDDWFCHECCVSGTEIEVYRKRAGRFTAGWQPGTIITNYKNGSCDVRMSHDGSLLHLNLNYYRWRPRKVHDLAHICASLGILPHDDKEIESDKLTRLLHHVLQQIEPKNYGQINKLPKDAREKWDESMDKEWNSIIEKEVFDLIDIDKVPVNADIVPTQWVYKIKADGRHKSRVVAMGTLLVKIVILRYSNAHRIFFYFLARSSRLLKRNVFGLAQYRVLE